jgi:hypothetical protein
MLEYVHELPTSIQREGVTHASVGKTIIDNQMLHAEVAYGTLNSDGEFEESDLTKEQTGTHKLVVPDMQDFAGAPSSLDTLPATKGDLLEASAKGLALYADSNELWPGL